MVIVIMETGSVTEPALLLNNASKLLWSTILSSLSVNLLQSVT